MPDFFSVSDYRKLFSDLLRGAGRGSQSRLAEVVGCQQAFLSRVLKGLADLSPEQAIRAASFFNLGPLEREYWLHLISENRAGNPELRSYHQEKLTQIREEQRNLNRRIATDNPITEAEKARYYSEWYYAAIHMLLATPGMGRVDVLAKHLNIDPTLVADALSLLVRAGLISNDSGEHRLAAGRIHLPPTHPLVRKHHSNWRLHSMQRLANPRREDFHYTSVMTCAAKDKEKVQGILADAVTKIRELVKESADEAACFYSLDLYEV